jgi:inward rectifier potassium channel
MKSVALAAAAREEARDLGFGTVVATESRRRLLNKDGSFNVVRRGLPLRATLSPYSALLTMSWPRFLALVGAFYLVANALFAFGYLALGRDALIGPEHLAAHGLFWRAFFFSVESLATVGYGHIVPASFGAHALMTLESLAGLLMLALATGMAFARFSRPVARIAFSDRAVVAPYRGGTAFEFRIANQRKSQLIEVEAQVTFSRLEVHEGRRLRRFYSLPLERQRVMFFPLAWTVVHPIDEASPLRGLTREDLLASDAEFLVLLTAIDDAFAQTVHARSSYAAEEVVWSARFADIFLRRDGPEPVGVDLGRLDGIEAV